MRYRVIGANKDTGARQVQEFEAESKAAAERKALQSGMTVNRIEDITDGYATHAIETGSTRRKAHGMHPVLKLVIFLLIVGAAWYFGWPHVRGMLGRG
jgi:hypothetical protein